MSDFSSRLSNAVASAAVTTSVSGVIGTSIVSGVTVIPLGSVICGTVGIGILFSSILSTTRD